MAAAYATLVSAMNIINNLHHHPRPPISLHTKQVESLTQKINFLLQFLESYNPHRDYSKEADPLECRIADAAYAAEHAIESHILDQFTKKDDKDSYQASIEEEAKEIQGRVGVQHQHQLPPDSSTSSSIPQQSSIVGADDVKLQMIDKLTSHCYDLSKIKKIIKKKIKKIRESWSPTNNGENIVHLEKMVEDMASNEEEAKQIQGRVGVQHQLHTNSTPSDSSKSSSILQQSSMAGADNGENVSYDDLYEAMEKVIKDMASIEEEAKQIQGRVGVQHQLPPDSSRSYSIPQQSSMVGADDLKLQMMDKLTSNRLHLQIIPIVGMGGSGKTTLARTIYEEPLIKEHFDICAWATISQEYIISEIFAAVLRQINIALDDDLNDDELGEMLHKHLYGRRYLIIMDDMWSINAWDRVRNYFPNNENGSRIVVTTRLSDLASTLPNSDSLGMNLLDEDESWELLSKTVFGEEGCPLELEEIGKKIGKTCKGLPLSIVVVGGLLAKSKHEKEFWKDIGENFNNASVNLEDDERCLKILYMSYKQLPIHLKPCFLYMGVFPEDEKIYISELIKYWVVEGFVKTLSGNSLEEIAKEYLKDLIDRNLVLSHELDNIGNIKKCKIHDLLRDLCLREAQKERFFYTASDNVAIRILPPMSQARSLTWNVQKIKSPRNTSLLRIVKTTGDEWVKKDLFEHTNQFVNSRFVQIGSYEIRLRNYPCSIWRFWNLQTLIVDTSNEVTAPTDFWYMPHIRHVEFDNGLRLPDPPNDQDDIVLGNLQSLGKGLDFKCSKQVVKKIPNIKKLVFSNWGERDDEMYCLSNLDCLTKLESLQCEISGKCVINFPHSLKSLVLRNSILSSWQDILDKVGVLPHLQELTLWLGSFNEGKWETSEGQFCSLKFLTLEYSNLEIWEIENSHFPCLECLHLDGLNELREIPLDFAEIATLREIVVEGCSDSTVVSAKRISEEHEDYYGEGALQVRVVLWSNNEAGLESLDGPNFCVGR